VIPHDTIVSHVRIHHEEVVVPHSRHHTATTRARVQSGEFTNSVIITDDECTFLPAVFFVLRNCPDAGELKDTIFAPDRGVPFNHRMRANPSFLADLHMRSDDCVWADFHLSTKPGGRSDNG
jgi:hypothetical protein